MTTSTSKTPALRFVLEAIDPATQCVAFDASFEVADLNGLCALLELGPADLDPPVHHDLEGEVVLGIARALEVGFDPGSFRSTIRTWCRLTSCPARFTRVVSFR